MRPALVAGIVNWDASPIGADHIWFRTPLEGSALYASSEPFAPVLLSACTSHTMAEVASVPLDVMTGDPEEKPYSFCEAPTLSSTGADGSVPSNLRAYMLSVLPQPVPS